MAVGGLNGGWNLGLRVLADAKGILRTQIVTSCSKLLFATIGAWIGGAVAASWGYAAGITVGALAYWLQFRRSLRQHKPVPAVLSEAGGDASDEPPETIGDLDAELRR
jgi:hypothetical protein